MTIDFSAGLYNIIHEYIGTYMTRLDFQELYRILEYCKGLNWTTQIQTEINLMQDLFTTCILLAHALLVLTCSYLLHDLFIICL